MRIAIIDCGTNTFHLLIIDLDNKKYSKIHQSNSSVKLGESAFKKGTIARIPFKRGISALTVFKKQINKYQVTKVFAYATSVIRDASNGIDFINQVKIKLNISILIIDGKREAELIYNGVKEAVKLSKKTSLIIDIGGGSTEFIFANKKNLFWKHSFSIGVARLLEKFKPSNPITQLQIKSINLYLEKELKPLFKADKIFQSHELIGSSGTFESLIEMNYREFGGKPFKEKKTEYKIKLSQYKKVSELIIKSKLEDRKKIKGLVSMRLDSIVISFLLINFVLNSLRLKKIRVSAYSLKEGALVEYVNKKNRVIN